jgi:hypothetical protein
MRSSRNPPTLARPSTKTVNRLNARLARECR